VALGVASVLASALLMTTHRDTRPFAAVNTVGQNGIAAVAFGLGGGAAFAGLLHLVLHTLAKSALLQGLREAGAPRSGLWRDDRPAAALVLAAGLGVAGLPPAGVFVSEFLVIAEATRQAPLVAALLAAGIVVAAVAVLAWLQRLVLGPATPGTGAASPPTTRPAALLGAWAALALAAVLGIAMPEPLLALLRAAAR
jgi:hydrogenase-4 component F